MPKSWTKDQQDAIDLRGRSLLVAAAAGSGKTAVLIERILQRILDPADPCEIDRMLIVTFTRAAAAQMRDRLTEELTKRLDADPENLRIRRQLMLLPYASVTTIDSFCLEVVRDHSAFLPVDPSFRVADEGEMRLLAEDVLAGMIEERFEAADPVLMAAAERYGGNREDGRLQQLIRDLHGFAQSYPRPEEWLEQCRRDLDPEAGGEDRPWLTGLQEELRRTFSLLSEETDRMLALCDQRDESGCGPYPYADAIRDDQAFLRSAQEAADLWEMCAALNAYSASRLSSRKDSDILPELKEEVKARRDEMKKVLTDLKKKYGRLTQGVLREDLAGISESVGALLELAEDYGRRLMKAKTERAILEFSDVEHLALQVLTEKTPDGIRRTEAARSLSEKYEEVMIDEYQDESRLQEEILYAVSREDDGAPNRFMVGDVKQSIYKFRLARPELFMEKHSTYSAEPGLHQRVDLHRNFRSRPEVLSWVNHLFGRIMKQPLGGVEYDREAAFQLPAFTPESAYLPELWLQPIEEDSEENALAQEGGRIIVRIRSLIEEGFPVRGEDGVPRPVRPGDIAILLRSGKGRAEQLAEQLLQAGIPARAETKTGYFEAWEVRLALGWLRVIDQPLDDVALAGVLHSETVGLSAEQLAGMVADYRESEEAQTSPGLYPALQRYAQTDQSGICRDFLERLERLRAAAARIPLTDLLQLVYEETGLLDMASVMPGGAVRRANLEMLIEKASDFENTSYHGLFRFLRYIDRIRKYEVDLPEGQAGEAGADQVRIMTVHGSKGLEFPVVFVAGLQRRMNLQDARAAVLTHPDWGISADRIDPERRLRVKTAVKQIFADRIVEDAKGEELRVLYVALTRAKDKLILTAAVKDPDAWLQEASRWAENVPTLLQIKNASSWLDWIRTGCRGAGCGISVRIPDTKLESERISDDKNRLLQAKEALLRAWPADPRRLEQIDEALRYRYPGLGDSDLPGKISVSELKRRFADAAGEEEAPAAPVRVLDVTGPLSGPDGSADQRSGCEAPARSEAPLPQFLRGQEPETAAARGTQVHRILELWDYREAPSPEKIEAVRSAAGLPGLLPRHSEDLLWFLLSPAAERMAAAQKAGRLHRESQFMIGVPAGDLFEGLSDAEARETVLLQGVIDAWIDAEGGIELIDYKTDRIPAGGTEEIVRRYRRQLDLYRRALEQMTGRPVVRRELALLSAHETVSL